MIFPVCFAVLVLRGILQNFWYRSSEATNTSVLGIAGQRDAAVSAASRLSQHGTASACPHGRQFDHAGGVKSSARIWFCQTLSVSSGCPREPGAWATRLTPHRPRRYCDTRGALILEYPHRVILEQTCTEPVFSGCRGQYHMARVFQS